MKANQNMTGKEDLVHPAIISAVQFWTYLVFLVPSTISSLSMLYYIVTHQRIRSAPQHHAPILILLYALIPQLTIFPGMLYFYHVNGLWHRPMVICQLWAFIDWTCFITQMLLIAYASIERHLFIFHDRWMLGKTKLFFFHYLPILIILIYCPIVYGFAYLYPPCGYLQMAPLLPGCVDSCLMLYLPFVTYDVIVHQVLPVLVLSLGNLTLLLRIFRQKLRILHHIKWRQHRKMAFQFFILSSIYIICISPFAIGTVYIYSAGAYQGKNQLFEWLAFISYISQLWVPFTFGFSLPEIRKKIRRVLGRKHFARVSPIEIPLRNMAPVFPNY